jgi:hypothetical protein
VDTEPDSGDEEPQEAYRQAMRAHLSAAHLHREAAEVHRRAAVHHELAANAGAGDSAQQKEAAAAERAASLRDLEAADSESDMAREESQKLAHALDDPLSRAERARTESHP